MRDRLTTKRRPRLYRAFPARPRGYLLDDLGAYDDERRDGFPVFARLD
jgi:hypothetical protein